MDNSIGPQKSPSSVAKIQAETKAVQRELAESTCKNCYYYSVYYASPHDWCELSDDVTHPSLTCSRWKQNNINQTTQ